MGLRWSGGKTALSFSLELATLIGLVKKKKKPKSYESFWAAKKELSPADQQWLSQVMETCRSGGGRSSCPAASQYRETHACNQQTAQPGTHKRTGHSSIEHPWKSYTPQALPKTPKAGGGGWGERKQLWGEICEMRWSPAILINKKCCSHQRFVASKYEWALPKLRSSRCCHPSWGLLRSWGNARSKVNNETGLAPDTWGAYERSEFREPRGLRLPVHRMLNSLTWYLISDVQTACFLCWKLVYSLTFSPASLEQFSHSFWDADSRALSPKRSRQIK